MQRTLFEVLCANRIGIINQLHLTAYFFSHVKVISDIVYQIARIAILVAMLVEVEANNNDHILK